MDTTYADFKKIVERKRKLIDKHQKHLVKLLDQCPHLELEQLEQYFPGGYLSTAHTEYWNQCKLCGKRSETTTESHNWYG